MITPEKELVANILIELGGISARPLLTPKPINLTDEKYKFLKDTNYNPIFEYHSAKDLTTEKGILDDIAEKIYSYKFEKDVENYLLTISDYILNICILNENLGNDLKFNEALRKVYSWDFELNQKFDVLLSELPVDSSPELNASDIEFEVRSILKTYELNSWQVRRREDRNSVSIDTELESIFIGSNIKKSPTGLKKLIIHEIDTHVLRFVNSTKSGFNIVELGNFPLKIPTEEGFAIFNEYQNKVLTRDELQNYVNRFILAQKEGASFSDIYSMCTRDLGYEKAKAFETTYRLKRGFVNTDNGFIHLKDSAYLKGFDILLNSIKTKDDYKFLFNGRITLHEKILIEYEVFNYKPYLPDWVEGLSFEFN